MNLRGQMAEYAEELKGKSGFIETRGADERLRAMRRLAKKEGLEVLADRIDLMRRFLWVPRFGPVDIVPARTIKGRLTAWLAASALWSTPQTGGPG